MKTKMDETNKAIIRQLSSDGRKAFSAISEELGITENTVRTRVSKLVNDQTMQITSLVNPECIPGTQVVFMGVKLSTLDLERKAKEFLKLRGVMSVVVVTGRYDLIVQVLLSEDDDLSLLDFFKHELDEITEVAEVETFVVYQSHNYWIPYTL
ncbi:MAG: Lrp/AsnC family transcriptional regulator [Sphaerochaetaceae bacterium]|jgi:Lrp/AsnC family transcriptional regulator for asnA, asnC and gidA